MIEERKVLLMKLDIITEALYDAYFTVSERIMFTESKKEVHSQHSQDW